MGQLDQKRLFAARITRSDSGRKRMVGLLNAEGPSRYSLSKVRLLSTVAVVQGQLYERAESARKRA